MPVIRDYPEFNSLSNRRKLLESRITSRKIGSTEQIPVVQKFTTTGYRHESPDRVDNRTRSRSMGRDVSPAGPKREATRTELQRNVNRAKSYERDTNQRFVEDSFDEMDGPVEQDYVYQQSRFMSSNRAPAAVIDLGFIEDLQNTDTDDHYLQHQKYQERYRHEFEPISLESQFNDVVLSPKVTSATHHREFLYPEQVHTLRRERSSLERGDSGIERDYRKGSAGAKEEPMQSRWRASSVMLLDPKTVTEQFLKRERLHSERLQANRYNLVFRERSIDDGSHFDPRLDKYPVVTRTFYRHQSTSPTRQSIDHNGTHNGRSETNKLGKGFEKVNVYQNT